MIKGAAEVLGADVSEGSSWDKIETLTNTLLGFSSGMSQIVQSATSGNIGGMLSGVTGIFTGFISGFAALHDKSRERTIQRLQEQVDELDRINKRIDRQAGKQYSREAADSYERMMANNRRQIDLIQQQIDAERDKKKTDDDRIQEWEDQIEELRNQIEDYKDAALDAIIGEDISTSIDNFAEKMADSWGNTKQAARDARQYVKDMLRQMVIEAMKTDLSDPVRRLRDMMSRAMSDGVVTDAEQKGMEDFAKKMAEDMQRRYDWASDIIDTAESGQNGGDRGGFATASQDSVDELNGRFAAMHTSIEMARQSLGTIQIDTSGIRAQLAEQNRIAQEARSMHVTAIGHLEAISKNTRQLYEMNERLAQIEKNTKGL